TMPPRAPDGADALANAIGPIASGVNSKADDRAIHWVPLGPRTSRASRARPQLDANGAVAALARAPCDGPAKRPLVSSPPDAARRRHCSGGRDTLGRLARHRLVARPPAESGRSIPGGDR